MDFSLFRHVIFLFSSISDGKDIVLKQSVQECCLKVEARGAD